MSKHENKNCSELLLTNGVGIHLIFCGTRRGPVENVMVAFNWDFQSKLTPFKATSVQSLERATQYSAGGQKYLKENICKTKEKEKN